MDTTPCLGVGAPPSHAKRDNGDMMKKPSFPCRSRSSFLLRTALAATLTSAGAMAQDPPAEPAPAAEPPGAAAPAEGEAPPAEAAPAAAPEPEPAPEPMPAPAEAAPEAPMVEPMAEPMPMPEPEPEPEAEAPKVNVGAWLRVGFKFQGKQDPEKLNDVSLDQSYGELHTSGSITDKVNWTFNFNANGNAGTVGILDAIVQLEMADPFHLWVGQMLVPSDRNNFSGPFFMSPWNYPGLVAPRQGPTGRNTGATIWGDPGGTGKFKYYLGVFDLDGGDAGRPLYTGRLNLALIGDEPGFYHSSTYYGAKDILALGVGGQYQGQTPNQSENYRMFNADLLAEFTPGNAGTLTAEGAVYRYQEETDMATTGLMGLGSYLIPGDIGGGRIQLGGRYQGKWVEGAKNKPVTSINDFWLAYLIKDYNLRFTATYQRIYDAGPDPQSIQLGVQTIQ